jgi:hypothetical protein
MCVEQAMLIVTIVIAGFTGIAAIAAWFAAKETRRAMVGELISKLLDDYYSNEMLCAMICLSKWKKEKGEGFDLEFAKKRKTNYQEVECIDFMPVEW